MVYYYATACNYCIPPAQVVVREVTRPPFPSRLGVLPARLLSVHSSLKKNPTTTKKQPKNRPPADSATFAAISVIGRTLPCTYLVDIQCARGRYYPFHWQKIHKFAWITEQALVWYRVDKAAVVARQPNEPRPQSRSLQRGCSRCSSNAAQRENATTPTDSWDTTSTYITS